MNKLESIINLHNNESEKLKKINQAIEKVCKESEENTELDITYSHGILKMRVAGPPSIEINVTLGDIVENALNSRDAYDSVIEILCVKMKQVMVQYANLYK